MWLMHFVIFILVFKIDWFATGIVWYAFPRGAWERDAFDENGG